MLSARKVIAQDFLSIPGTFPAPLLSICIPCTHNIFSVISNFPDRIGKPGTLLQVICLENVVITILTRPKGDGRTI